MIGNWGWEGTHGISSWETSRVPVQCWRPQPTFWSTILPVGRRPHPLSLRLQEPDRDPSGSGGHCGCPVRRPWAQPDLVHCTTRASRPSMDWEGHASAEPTGATADHAASRGSHVFAPGPNVPTPWQRRFTSKITGSCAPSTANGPRGRNRRSAGCGQSHATSAFSRTGFSVAGCGFGRALSLCSLVVSAGFGSIAAHLHSAPAAAAISTAI
jgi:hypothetical protein